jgi:F0F1-type ATP synthase membrane subunit c/vacuolar-type H+-ATPase subunit K
VILAAALSADYIGFGSMVSLSNAFHSIAENAEARQLFFSLNIISADLSLSQFCLAFLRTDSVGSTQ